MDNTQNHAKSYSYDEAIDKIKQGCIMYHPALPGHEFRLRGEKEIVCYNLNVPPTPDNDNPYEVNYFAMTLLKAACPDKWRQAGMADVFDTGLWIETKEGNVIQVLQGADSDGYVACRPAGTTDVERHPLEYLRRASTVLGMHKLNPSYTKEDIGRRCWCPQGGYCTIVTYYDFGGRMGMGVEFEDDDIDVNGDYEANGVSDLMVDYHPSLFNSYAHFRAYWDEWELNGGLTEKNKPATDFDDGDDQGDPSPVTYRYYLEEDDIVFLQYPTKYREEENMLAPTEENIVDCEGLYCNHWVRFDGDSKPYIVGTRRSLYKELGLKNTDERIDDGTIVAIDEESSYAKD